MGHNDTIAGDYNAKVRRLGISHAQWGRIARVDGRTERRWAAGEYKVTGPAVTLLDLLVARPELVPLAAELAGVTPRRRGKPRREDSGAADA